MLLQPDPPAGFCSFQFKSPKETFDSVVEALKAFPGVHYSPALGKGVWAAPVEAIDFVKTTCQKFQSTCTLHIPPARTINIHPAELYQHQIAGIEKCLRDQGCIFVWSPGTGKTRAAIGAIEQSHAKHPLVIAPPKAHFEWGHELKKWGVDCKVELCKLGQEPLSDDYDFIVLDESHKIRSPKIKRTKLAFETSRANPKAFKLCLTATPIDKAADIWSQAEFTFPGRFGSNFKFIGRYHITEEVTFVKRDGSDISYRNILEVNPQREGEWRSRVQAISHIVDVADCPDLPSMVLQPLYDDPEDTSVTTLLHFAAQSEANWDQLLAQTRVISDKQKINWAVDLAEEYADRDTPLIILSWRTETAKAIQVKLQSLLSEQVYYFDSTIPLEKRHEIIQHSRILVCTASSVEESINSLIKFPSAIIVDLHSSIQKMLQLLGRFRRLGGKSTLVQLLILKNSPEDPLCSALLTRHQASNTALSTQSSQEAINSAVAGESEDEWLMHLTEVAKRKSSMI